MYLLFLSTVPYPDRLPPLLAGMNSSHSSTPSSTRATSTLVVCHWTIHQWCLASSSSSLSLREPCIPTWSRPVRPHPPSGSTFLHGFQVGSFVRARGFGGVKGCTRCLALKPKGNELMAGEDPLRTSTFSKYFFFF